VTLVAEALPFTVKPIYWTACEKEIRAIRTRVFVEE
jgi:hypothetical protein